MQWYAIGDPQTSFERFQAVLDARGLLDGDRLRGDVGLISIGDHFDYGTSRGDDVAAAGLQILEWLASHDDEQVVILFGNHDVSRVMELARYDDARFAVARARAEEVKREALEEAVFLEEHPDLPTAELAHRDYSAFTVAQQRLVQRLLEGRRARIAHAAALEDGTPLLLTHAGVSTREVGHLDVEVTAEAIATALNALLDERVAAVAPDWTEPLDLTPLHFAGEAGVEGGGLMYHRPADPARFPAADFEGDRRRRFRPTEIPAGLVQAAGHLPHKKSLEILGEVISEAARALPRGALRSLVVEGGAAEYGPWPREAPAETALILIDGKMNDPELSPGDYQLLRLGEGAR
jgi:hypothetical protein